MKKMIAVVRDEEGQIKSIKSEYPTKKAFRRDLNANGYVVVGRIEIEGEEQDDAYNRGYRGLQNCKQL